MANRSVIVQSTMFWVTLLPFVGAVGTAQAQTPKAELVAPFQESVNEEVSVSGTVIAGVSSTEVLAGRTLMQGFLVPNVGRTLCLTVRSRDGVYFSRNAFSAPADASGDSAELLLSLEGTKQKPLLGTYSSDDVAVAVTTGPCDEQGGTWLVPRGATDDFGSIDILVNGFGATDVFYVTASGHQGECSEFLVGRRTSYDFRCRIPRSKLVDGLQELAIERERHGRPLPRLAMRIALAAAP